MSHIISKIQNQDCCKSVNLRFVMVMARVGVRVKGQCYNKGQC